jgi:hypothetical protein
MHVFARWVGAPALAWAVFALAPVAIASETPISPEARMHFAAGVALLQDPKAPRYEEAYREFKAAYAASPSYKILGNLGLCAMKIERDAEAIAAYATYLKEAGADLTTAEREQIRRDLLTLRAGVVSVTVESDPPGATIVDVRVPVQGSDITNSYGQIYKPAVLGLRRGHHVLTAHMPGYPDQPWEFEASDATPPFHAFVMVPPPRYEGNANKESSVPVVEHRGGIAPLVTGGLSVALALGGTYFGIQALRKHDEYDVLNNGLHVTQADDVRSRGLTLNVITDAMFGAAIVSAGVTAYLVLRLPTPDHRVGAATSKSSLAAPSLRILPATLQPTWTRGSAGVSAAWVF